MPTSIAQLRPLRAPIALLVMFAVAACSSGDDVSAPEPRGSLALAISGLPVGAVASVTVDGPDGFTRTLSSGATLSSLAAGTYVITVNDVWHQGSAYTGAPPSQAIVVDVGSAITASGVVYALSTGSMSITMGGLPNATPAAVTITGPDGYHRTITEAVNLLGLKPGSYLVEARELATSAATYAANQGSQLVQVVATTEPSVVHVAYAITTGAMAINVSGLPDGKNAAVSVTGPGNYLATVTSWTSTLENLAPGVYTIAASNVSNGSIFIPSPASQQVTVTASAQPVAATVAYASAGTALNVQLLGLPQGMGGAVTVAGPNGYNALVSSSKVLSGIPSGVYTISASPVNLSCDVVTPTQPTQLVTVPPGQAATVAVSYSSAAAGINLCIDGAYITQAVQTLSGDVPLVAGRDGLLRVFVRASGANSAMPPVRARFYNGSTLVNTILIQPTAASVPLTIDEATLGLSWNANLPGSLLQPGLRLLVDVDPSNLVAESNESDNSQPANGAPVTLDVRTAAPLGVRFVPVIQAARGDTGRVTESNKASFVAPMLKMFPVPSIDADIRQPYLFSGGELQSGGANWTTLLSELNAVRVAEGSARIYYGVVRVGYTSGVAGLGYIGVPTSVGWDYQPGGAEVLAHEVGHNFGRLHAPCGGPSGVDAQFPYTGATIGAFGYDLSAATIKFPVLRDLMSYCDPSWISDYTYKAILNFRSTFPMKAGAVTSSARERGLLVWGRIEQGRVVLEPGFEVDAPALIPTQGGPHQLTGVGASGEPLFSFNFTGDRVADSPGGNDETFAFVVPVSRLRGVELAAMRLSARGRQVELRSSGSLAVPTATRLANGRVRVTWNGAPGRAALIRDARTGAILSVARGGSVDVQSSSSDFEITLSDGVKSVKSSLRPR